MSRTIWIIIFIFILTWILFLIQKFCLKPYACIQEVDWDVLVKKCALKYLWDNNKSTMYKPWDNDIIFGN